MFTVVTFEKSEDHNAVFYCDDMKELRAWAASMVVNSRRGNVTVTQLVTELIDARAQGWPPFTQLQPDLLRRAAMICQSFTRFGCSSCRSGDY